MPTKILYDLSKVDFVHPEFNIDAIRSVNPQRFEFEQLTAVDKHLPDEGIIIGHLDISEDEFWVRGHIPGNPVFPGVLMLEAAAQLCSFFQLKYVEENRFFGFAGVNSTKFRGTVLPGDRFIIISKAILLRRRRSTFYCQGVVKNTLVFEAEISGICLS